MTGIQGQDLAEVLQGKLGPWRVQTGASSGVTIVGVLGRQG
jgi:hypothetical protein